MNGKEKVTTFDDFVIKGLKTGYSYKTMKRFSVVLFFILFITKKDTVTFSLESARNLCMATKKRSFREFLHRKISETSLFFYNINRTIKDFFMKL